MEYVSFRRCDSNCTILWWQCLVLAAWQPAANLAHGHSSRIRNLKELAAERERESGHETAAEISLTAAQSASLSAPAEFELRASSDDHCLPPAARQVIRLIRVTLNRLSFRPKKGGIFEKLEFKMMIAMKIDDICNI